MRSTQPVPTPVSSHYRHPPLVIHWMPTTGVACLANHVEELLGVRHKQSSIEHHQSSFEHQLQHQLRSPPSAFDRSVASGCQGPLTGEGAKVCVSYTYVYTLIVGAGRVFGTGFSWLFCSCLAPTCQWPHHPQNVLSATFAVAYDSLPCPGIHGALRNHPLRSILSLVPRVGETMPSSPPRAF